MSVDIESKCHYCGEFENDCECLFCEICGQRLESENCDCEVDEND